VAHGPHRTRRHQVLYVEDNPVNAIIIGELLARRHDLHLHVAVDGTSGVAQALAIKPDLILLDMQLPDCDGFEVLRRLRAEPATAGIPCIALSANAIPEEIERALSAGLSDYWTKPLDFKAFMASLDALFGKAN
jgi:CheY-like chemotaxis protein